MKQQHQRKSTSSETSLTSRLSTLEIQGKIEQLKHQQYRDSTKKNYYAIWKVFNNFFVRLDYIDCIDL